MALPKHFQSRCPRTGIAVLIRLCPRQVRLAMGIIIVMVAPQTLLPRRVRIGLSQRRLGKRSAYQRVSKALSIDVVTVIRVLKTWMMS